MNYDIAEATCFDMMPGDKAVTNYNSRGPKWKEVTITQRAEKTMSQSGVMYRVYPALEHGDTATWYDAGWFRRIEA